MIAAVIGLIAGDMDMATHPTDRQRAGILTVTILVATCVPPIMMASIDAVSFIIDHYVLHHPISVFDNIWPGGPHTTLLFLVFWFLPGGLLAAVLSHGLYQRVHTSFLSYLGWAFGLALLVWGLTETYEYWISDYAIPDLELALELAVVIGFHTLSASITMFSLSKRLGRRHKASTDTEAGASKIQRNSI